MCKLNLNLKSARDIHKGLSSIILLLLVVSANSNAKKGPWQQIFNGKNLDGWTAKFAKYPLGNNFNNTFRVENGLLKVSYQNYQKFDNEFGHLFYKTPFSSYNLKLEYRFVGEQVNEGPAWAYKNSGIMLHAQNPKTMTIDQSFPVSIEAQILGGNGNVPRPTANVCTPGTHIMIRDELITDHCVNTESKTFHDGQWVTMEVKVRTDKLIQHWVNEKLVFTYNSPQLDSSDSDATPLINKQGSTKLASGYISLQAESHPIEFKNIQIQLVHFE